MVGGQGGFALSKVGWSWAHTPAGGRSGALSSQGIQQEALSTGPIKSRAWGFTPPHPTPTNPQFHVFLEPGSSRASSRALDTSPATVAGKTSTAALQAVKGEEQGRQQLAVPLACPASL